MQERRKIRIWDTKEANRLKEEGNEFLKKGLYKSAVKWYTEAIELRKDIMQLYSNRALARNKIEDY